MAAVVADMQAKVEHIKLGQSSRSMQPEKRTCRGTRFRSAIINRVEN